MYKRNFLNPLTVRVLGFIYFNSPVIDNYENIALKGNLTTYFVKSEIAKLCEKNWIIKKRSGKKIVVKMAKKSIPLYMSQAFEKFIDSGDPLFA